MTHGNTPATFLEVQALFFERDAFALVSLLDGVSVGRMGDVAKSCPTVYEHWTASPQGFSKQPQNVISWLGTQGMAIYSAVGNTVIKHGGCHRMIKDLLREIRADDFVIIADVRYETGAAVMRGDHDAVVPTELINRVDYRRANQTDVDHIYSSVIWPTWYALQQR